MKKFKQLSIILLCLLAWNTPLAFAEGDHEGSHTGNGGGVVTCPGKKPQVLDYFEAERDYGKDSLFDLEYYASSSELRQKFFSIIEDRIEDAETPRKQFGIHFSSSWKVDGKNMSFHQAFKYYSNKIGPFDLWKTTAPWKLHDEAIKEDLPVGCEFQQGALTDEAGTFRIKETTKDLSPGQKLVLELHEVIYSLTGLSWMDFVGTSNNARKFVGVLLKNKKSTSYREQRLALLKVEHPFDQYEWKHGQEWLVVGGDGGAQDMNPFYRYTGAYFLDLRQMTASQKEALSSCPRALAVEPSLGATSFLYSFADQGALQESRITETILPGGTETHLRHTLIGEWNQSTYQRGVLDVNSLSIQWDLQLAMADKGVSLKMNGAECPYRFADSTMMLLSDAPKMLNPATHNRQRQVLQIRHIIQYFEEKSRGLKSEFDSEVEKLRSDLNW